MTIKDVEDRINDITVRTTDGTPLGKKRYDELDGELIVYKTTYDLLKEDSRLNILIARLDTVERFARHLFDRRLGLALLYYPVTPKTFKDGVDRRGGDISEAFILSACRTCRLVIDKARFHND